MLEQNIIVDTDAYKLSHWLQYPKGLEYMYSYGEARSGSKFDHIAWFGLQMILMDHFVGKVITLEKIEQAEAMCRAWFNTPDYFNKKAWIEIYNRYGGHLPMTIKSLPEGTIVNKSNVLFTMESNDLLFAGLLNSMETLLTHVWYPTTVLTNQIHIIKDIYPLFNLSGKTNMMEYIINDFSFRGVSCFQEAYRGGAAHLVVSRGSDNIAGDRALNKYYNNPIGRLQSVLATEHSVATIYGSGEGEIKYVRNLLTNPLIPSTALISVVGDSYNIFRFAKEVMGNPEIKQLIIEREGRFVLRPDSGNPDEVCLALLNILANEVFGYTVEHGLKVISHNVGLIQGDKMNRETIYELYTNLVNNGWSAANLVVGSGGGLLREHVRDDISFATKASFSIVDDKSINIQKNPITSPGKVSKTGMFKVTAGITKNFLNDYRTINHESPGFENYIDELEVVFSNGVLQKTYTFEDVLKNFELNKFIEHE